MKVFHSPPVEKHCPKVSRLFELALTIKTHHLKYHNLKNEVVTVIRKTDYTNKTCTLLKNSLRYAIKMSV